MSPSKILSVLAFVVLVAAAATTQAGLVAQYKLDAPPAWDNMAVANDRLFLSLKDGRVVCMSGK